MSDSSPTITLPAKNVMDGVTVIAKQLKDINTVETEQISDRTKNLIIIIEHFIDTPSKNEVYRAQTHVANMMDKIEDDSPVDKKSLKTVQMHLDKIYDILEQHNMSNNEEERINLQKIIDDTIENKIKIMNINTSECIAQQPQFPVSSTPLTLCNVKNKPTGAIAKAFEKQINLERNLDTTINKADNDDYSDGEKQVIDYISRRDYEHRVQFFRKMSEEFDHDTFGFNVRESKILTILNMSGKLHEHASIPTENTNLSYNLRVPFTSDD